VEGSELWSGGDSTSSGWLQAVQNREEMKALLIPAGIFIAYLLFKDSKGAGKSTFTFPWSSGLMKGSSRAEVIRQYKADNGWVYRFVVADLPEIPAYKNMKNLEFDVIIYKESWGEWKYKSQYGSTYDTFQKLAITAFIKKFLLTV
jgi:hypothetical protein